LNPIFAAEPVNAAPALEVVEKAPPLEIVVAVGATVKRVVVEVTV
jgi:hypothetical protein